MGRIKSLLVKRTARKLFKEENLFKEDFNVNKILLKNVDTSKSIKNKISGYLARLKRQQREKRAVTEIK